MGLRTPKLARSYNCAIRKPADESSATPATEDAGRVVWDSRHCYRIPRFFQSGHADATAARKDLHETQNDRRLDSRPRLRGGRGQGPDLEARPSAIDVSACRSDRSAAEGDLRGGHHRVPPFQWTRRLAISGSDKTDDH